MSIPLAVAFDNFVSAILAQAMAPLIERIDALEKANALGEPTPDYVAQMLDRLTEGEKFNEAVLKVIDDRPSTVMDSIEDELKTKMSEIYDDRVCSAVEETINRGSFSIDFSRY